MKNKVDLLFLDFLGGSPLQFQKHYSHDQKTHGNWATGVDPEVGQKVRQFTQEWGGLSINMVDGSMPEKGYMVAKPPEFGEVVDAADFLNPSRGDKILSAYMRRHKEDLSTGKNYLGTWLNEGKVYLDVSQNVQQRETAVRLGRERNQKAIWDVVNMEEIDTGGTGVAEKAGRYGRVEEFEGYDRRRDRRIREGHLQENRLGHGGTSNQTGLDKHYSHDQRDHGNWAGGRGTTVMPSSVKSDIERIAGKRSAATAYGTGYDRGETEEEVTYQSDLDRKIQNAVMTRDRILNDMDNEPESPIHNVKAIMAESAMAQQGYIDGSTKTKRMYRRQYPTFMEYLTAFPSGKFASRSLTKHQAGTHDQESHGDWADGDSVEVKGQGKPVNVVAMKKIYKDNDYYVSKLPKEQRSHIYEYLMGGNEINRAIHRGDPKYYYSSTAPDLIKDVDAAIENAPLLNGDFLYRMTRSDELSGINVGDVIESPAYLSTSANKISSPAHRQFRKNIQKLDPETDKVFLKITGNAGKSGLVMPAVWQATQEDEILKSENEVVLPRNTRLRVKSIEDVKIDGEDTNIYEMERIT